MKSTHGWKREEEKKNRPGNLRGRLAKWHTEEGEVESSILRPRNYHSGEPQWRLPIGGKKTHPLRLAHVHSYVMPKKTKTRNNNMKMHMHNITFITLTRKKKEKKEIHLNFYAKKVPKNSYMCHKELLAGSVSSGQRD